MNNTVKKGRPEGTSKYKFGDTKVNREGYRKIYVGMGHVLSDFSGFASEANYFLWRDLGIIVKPDEHIHHINGNKLQNNLENLIVLKKDQHLHLHRKLESTYTVKICPVCNCTYVVTDWEIDKKTCSAKCGYISRRMETMKKKIEEFHEFGEISDQL